MESFESKGGYLLAGSTGDEEGGLVEVIPSKKQDFKKPSVSLLGLDVLAKKKREESGRSKAVQQDQSGSRRRKEEAADDKDDVGYFNSRISFGKPRERQYREQQSETPSHTGGVSEEAIRRSRERRGREREQGVFASSKGGERKRYHERMERDDDDDRKRAKSDSDYRYRDREGWRRGQDRRGARDSERRREGDSERRSRREGDSERRSGREGGWSSRSQRSVHSWEETPEREVEGECTSEPLLTAYICLCLIPIASVTCVTLGTLRTAMVPSVMILPSLCIHNVCMYRVQGRS